MQPAKYDIKIKQGAAYTPSAFVFSDSLGPINLTGCVGKAQIRTLGDSVVIAEFTVTITPLTGSIQLYLSDESTALIPCTGTMFKDKAQYSWDLLITPPSGDAYFILEGVVYVTPRATIS